MKGAGALLFLLAASSSAAAQEEARPREALAAPLAELASGSLAALLDDAVLRGSLVGRKDDWDVVDEDGGEIGDRLRLRQLDLDLGGALTPWARAFVAVGLRSAPVTSFEVELEEGWVETRDLLAAPALDLTLRAGHFRSSFGRTNRLRVFDLPWPTRPLAQERFLGQRGFAQTGLAGRLRWADAEARRSLAWTVELLDSGDLPITETEGDEGFAVATNLDGCWNPAPRTRLEAGLSGYSGKQSGLRSAKSHLLGVDLLLSHAARHASAGAFQLGGELYQAILERPGASDLEPGGGYAWAQLEPLPGWHLGLRFDAAEDLEAPSVDTRRYGVYLNHAAWDRLRFGLGFEYSTSDDPELDDRRSVFATLTFGLGARVPRPFWAGD